MIDARSNMNDRSEKSKPEPTNREAQEGPRRTAAPENQAANRAGSHSSGNKDSLSC